MYSKKYQARHTKKKSPPNEYREATERARVADGYLVCEFCYRSLLDGEEQRHHKTFRSQGGKNTADNLIILCSSCHFMQFHKVTERTSPLG